MLTSKDYIDQYDKAMEGKSTVEAEIAFILGKTDNNVVFIDEHPNLQPLIQKITAMVAKISQPIDGDTPIHVALINDMSFNAFMSTTAVGTKKESQNIKILGINLGLLKEIDTEDELAFVIGHELEHPLSEVDAARRRMEGKENIFNGKARERAEEVEVDVKSSLRRMREADYHPNAALTFTKKIQLQEKGISSTHAVGEARVDGIAAALTAMERFDGKPLLAPVYKTEINKMLDAAKVFTKEYWEKFILEDDSKFLQRFSSELENDLKKILFVEHSADYYEENKLKGLDKYSEYWKKKYEAKFGFRKGTGFFSDDELYAKSSKITQSLLKAIEEKRSQLMRGINFEKVSTSKKTILRNWAYHLQSVKFPIEPELKTLLGGNTLLEEIRPILNTTWGDYHKALTYYNTNTKKEREAAALELLQAGLDHILREIKLHEEDRRISYWTKEMSELLVEASAVNRKQTEKIFAKFYRNFLDILPTTPLYGSRDGVDELIIESITPEHEPFLFEHKKNSLGFQIQKIFFQSILKLDPSLRESFIADYILRMAPFVGAHSYKRKSSNQPSLSKLLDSIDQFMKSNLISLEELNNPQYRDKPIQKAWRSFFENFVSGVKTSMDSVLLQGRSVAEKASLFAIYNPDFYHWIPADIKPNKDLLVKSLQNIFIHNPGKDLWLLRIPKAENYFKIFSTNSQQDLDTLRSLLPIINFETDYDEINGKARVDFAKFLEKEDFEKYKIKIFQVLVYDKDNSKGSLGTQDYLSKFLQRYFDLKVNDNPSDSISDIWKKGFAVILELTNSLKDDTYVLRNPALEKFIEEMAPKDFLNRLLFLKNYYQFSLDNRKLDGELEQKKWPFHFSYQNFDISIENIEKANVPLEDLAEFTKLALLQEGGYSDDLDELFDYTWKKIHSRKDVQEKFLAPELVTKLVSKEKKIALAKWQLQQKFPIEEAKKQIQANGKVPTSQRIRPMMREIVSFIEKQFPSPSDSSSSVTEYIEKTLFTSRAESELLSKVRLTQKNLAESKAIAAIDLPHISRDIVSGKEKSYHNLLQTIRYFSMQTDEFPDFFKKMKAGVREKRQYEFQSTRLHLIKEHPIVRAYAFLPYLDHGNGILADKASEQKIYAMILGDHKNNRLLKKILEVYLESLSPERKEQQLACYLSTLIDSTAKKSNGLLLSQILEGMGPFGTKVGQFLRSSGLLSEDLNKELNHFFSNALEPNRNTIHFGNHFMYGLDQVFGKNRSKVKRVYEIKGSGSINYVVHVDLKRFFFMPAKSVVVNIQRKTALSEITDESSIWQRASDKLAKSKIPGAENLAKILDESRESVMFNLNKDSAELNKSLERAFFPEVKEAYTSPKNPKTRYRVEVIKPDLGLQKLIAADFQDKVSIFPNINHTPIEDIADKNLQQDLYAQIADAELKAIFQKGIFDPDGHPGNWLHDASSKKLVRIDYAQFKNLNDTDPNLRRNLQKIVAALVMPNIPEHRIKDLAQNIAVLFQLEGCEWPLDTMESLLKNIVYHPKFPKETNLQNRIFYLRSKIEERLGVNVQPVKVRLTDPARIVFASITKTLNYREQIGSAKYGEILLEAFGIPKLEYAVHALGLPAFNHCLTEFQRIMRRPATSSSLLQK